MPGLLRGVARTAVISGTATAVSNRVSRRQAGRWAQQDYEQTTAAPPQQAYSAPPPSSPEPAAGASMDTKIAQLKELAQLKEQGVLSEAEFAAQKSRILEL
ncbi:SHOCT domain-containing protein [Streptomyces phaeoluteigriseus]|uniref:SHOCT domain-containing protein n=1 Tax=Streptomyces phaeoluteigriseus TaxID=114686 RepID=A0ABY4ZAH1_9ACTN|nr:SHOCT domain-containing protein [Streptomyces phaeoluteigriseus]USQ86033.1 SHOCT domain-containing protein [Streptomyces phaeoluteigriseus]